MKPKNLKRPAKKAGATPDVSGSTGNRNLGKPKICRLSSLDKFQGVLIGRDMGQIFEEGCVYEAYELAGEIMIRKLGKHAIPEYLEDKGTVNQYVTSGVVFLTEQEYEREKANR